MLDVKASRRGVGFVAVIVVAGMALGACGSDPDKAAEFTQSFETALKNDADTKYTPAEATCVAKPLVAALTVKQLETNKVTPAQVSAAKDLDDLNLKPTAAQATAIADEIVRCVDTSRNALKAVKESNPDLKADATAQKCVKSEFKSSSVFRDNLRDSIQQGKNYKADEEEIATFLMATLGKCELSLYSKSAYVEAALRSIEDGEDSPFSKDDAECIVGGMVDVITPAGLGREGVTPDDFEEDEGPDLSEIVTRSQAEEIAVKFDGCIDLLALVRSTFEEIGIFDNLPAEFSDCLFDGLSKDKTITEGMRQAFVAGILGDKDADPGVDFAAIGERIGAECGAKL
jgi:hypothetical protein